MHIHFIDYTHTHIPLIEVIRILLDWILVENVYLTQ